MAKLDQVLVFYCCVAFKYFVRDMMQETHLKKIEGASIFAHLHLWQVQDYRTNMNVNKSLKACAFVQWLISLVQDIQSYTSCVFVYVGKLQRMKGILCVKKNQNE